MVLKKIRNNIGPAIAIIFAMFTPSPVAASVYGEKAAERPAPEVFIEVNLPATELTLYENGAPLFRRRVSIGQGVYPTPEQESTIKRIEWNPWWYPPDSGWAKNAKPTPPGPGNPLGMVKMPISNAILFHGTNKDWSVGQAASHGCMRMHNNEAADMAWYLQSHFSEKTDPDLRQLYRRNNRTTYLVKLDKPAPVRLVYKPVIERDDDLIFFPDHYNRLYGRRRGAILSELIKNDFNINELEDIKVDLIVGTWPPRATKVPVASLMRGWLPSDIMEGPVCE